MRNQILVGDNRQTMRQIPAGCIQSIITSPPYWGLRDYGTATWEGGDPACDHKRREEQPRSERPQPPGRNRRNDIGGPSQDAMDAGRALYKGQCGKCGANRIDNQIGQEETPEQYVATMVEVFSEAKRILHPSGTLWLNLGDTYAANRGYQVPDNKHVDVGNSASMKVPDGYKAKDLLGIPFRVAFALQADGWFLRSIIPWVKRNPMPDSTQDRPGSAVEYIFLLAKSPRYFYDAEAVRVSGAEPDRIRNDRYGGANGATVRHGEQSIAIGQQETRSRRNSDWFWESWQGLYTEGDEPLAMVVNTHPYREAHFATFPPRLVLPCIQAGTPEAGCCSKCGEPGECDCKAERQPAIVFDPFLGSGTTAQVARWMGRHWLGCELNESYRDMAATRIEKSPFPSAGHKPEPKRKPNSAQQVMF